MSNLLKLVKDNPNLPIYAWVNGEVVQDDSHYWGGRFTHASIREYVELDYSYTHTFDSEWLFKDDTEDWEEYMLENYLEDDISEEEAEHKLQDELKNMKWKKAIFVYISEL